LSRVAVVGGRAVRSLRWAGRPVGCCALAPV